MKGSRNLEKKKKKMVKGKQEESSWDDADVASVGIWTLSGCRVLLRFQWECLMTLWWLRGWTWGWGWGWSWGWIY